MKQKFLECISIIGKDGPGPIPRQSSVLSTSLGSYVLLVNVSKRKQCTHIYCTVCLYV
jgi:hypothetical protein